MPMNDSDDPGCVFFDRNIHTEQIHVYLFTVAAEHIRYISVIDRVDKFRVLRVNASDRSVYFYIYRFPEIGSYKCLSQGTDDKIVLSLEIVLPAFINARLQGK